MGEFSSFETPFEYADDDRYIRAVRHNMIRRNGEIKASAFKSNRGGVSVTRCNDNVFEIAIAFMKKRFEGRMAVFSRMACREADIFEKHSPSPGHNIHHWELFGNREEKELSNDQIAVLIVVAELT